MLSSKGEHERDRKHFDAIVVSSESKISQILTELTQTSVFRQFEVAVVDEDAVQTATVQEATADGEDTCDEEECENNWGAFGGFGASSDDDGCSEEGCELN